MESCWGESGTSSKELTPQASRMKVLAVLLLATAVSGGMDMENTMKKWANYKAMESCWGEENMQKHTVQMKTAIAQCRGIDAPELRLSVYRSPFRVINALLANANTHENYLMQVLDRMAQYRAHQQQNQQQQQGFHQNQQFQQNQQSFQARYPMNNQHQNNYNQYQNQQYQPMPMQYNEMFKDQTPHQKYDYKSTMQEVMMKKMMKEMMDRYYEKEMMEKMQQKMYQQKDMYKQNDMYQQKDMYKQNDMYQQKDMMKDMYQDNYRNQDRYQQPNNMQYDQYNPKM